MNRTADTDVAREDESKEAEAVLRGVGKYAATPMDHVPSETQGGVDSVTPASKSAGNDRVSQDDGGNDADD